MLRRKPKSLMESVILIQQAFKTFLARKREREEMIRTPRHLSKPEGQTPDHFNGLSKVTAKHGSMGDKTLESDMHDEIIQQTPEASARNQEKKSQPNN